MKAKTIDHLAEQLEDGNPHIGPESEGIVTDLHTLNVVHRIKGQQPVQAIKGWVIEKLRDQSAGIVENIIPDVPETTAEVNPDPLRSPKSSAAAQRLMSALVQSALTDLSDGGIQLVHGAALRPPRITKEDASSDVEAWKRAYYQYQIGVYGDKIGGAAGDHLSLSAPWKINGVEDTHETTRTMIEMTGRMRLIGGAISIALSASSPLYFYSNGGRHKPTFVTALTQWESARLGEVWQNRTVMDLAPLFESPASFRRTMTKFTAMGILKSGRDIWLPVRAQQGKVEKGQSFEEICEEKNITFEQGQEYLMASFQFGDNNSTDNPYKDDPKWRAVEDWRRNMLKAVIAAPRNRVEIRTLETPPAFGEGADLITPYEYIKSVQTFLELLFIYLSHNPDFVANLEYDALNLQAAKYNEQQVLRGGLNSSVYWIPTMKTTSPREILAHLLDKIADLANGLGRAEDLEIVKRVVQGGLKTPAARIREEVGSWYNINIDNRENPRLLQDDSYPQALLRRTRQAIPTEVAQIEADISKMPASDRPYIQKLLNAVKQLQESPPNYECTTRKPSPK